MVDIELWSLCQTFPRPETGTFLCGIGIDRPIFGIRRRDLICDFLLFVNYIIGNEHFYIHI